MSSTNNFDQWMRKVASSVTATAVLGGCTVAFTLMPLKSVLAVSLYRLPYAAGETHYVTAGINGDNNSHHGKDSKYGNYGYLSTYAYDFGGTFEVVAARDGIVLETKGTGGYNCTPPNYSAACDRSANYVVIKHDNEDGTSESTLYLHLANDSLLVKKGDPVLSGQPIGTSGNTGYSTGAHLHFTVQEVPTGEDNAGGLIRNATSLFRTFADVEGGYPRFDQYYTSGNTGFSREQAEEDVEQIYQDVLDRPADSEEEIASYVDDLESKNRTLENIRQDILNNHKGEVKGKINEIYLEVLGREVDHGKPENGLESYTNFLANGNSLAQVREDVANSPESKDNINRIYQEKADRDASPEEIESFVSSLAANDATVEDVEWAVIEGVLLFPDVPRDYLFADDIYNLVSNNVVSGDNGYFRPEDPVKRGEFAKFITNAFGYETNTSCGAFPDVPFGSPFYNEITTLKCNEIIRGNDGLYLPEDPVKRAEATVFLVKGFNNLVDESLQLTRTYDKALFPDIGHLGEGFQDLIMTAYDNDIFNGNNGNFLPDDELKRGEASKVVNFTRNLLETTQAQNQDGARQPDKVFDNFKYFLSVVSGGWFDPPTNYGFEFEALGDTLFTDILDFPTGIDSDGLFTVSVGGEEIGVFGAGQSVDFVSLLGEGISNFLITDIDPLSGNDITDFALQLEFNEEIGSFRMRPFDESEFDNVKVPEPSSLLGLLAVGALGALTLRKGKRF
ncbi:MAG: S-layer homology domain-containing protein [Hormoscilla sp.]